MLTLMTRVAPFVWQADEQGRLRQIDQAWLEYTGFSQEQALQLGWLHVLHKDDIQLYSRTWQDALTQGFFEFECRVRNAQGHYRWFLARAERDASASNPHWNGTLTDIHDLKTRAEQMIQEAGIAVIEFNADHRLHFMTREAQTLLGPSLQVGQPWSEVLRVLLEERTIERLGEPTSPANASFTELELGPIQASFKVCPNRHSGLTIYVRGEKLKPVYQKARASLSAVS
jgi:PAS domain S-box-containing protein